MSYIRVCDRADGCQDEVYTLCEERGGDWVTSSAGASRMAAQGRGHGHGVTVFHSWQGPFTTTVSFVPHCSPAAGSGPGLALPFCALDSHEHILLEWALSMGHSPKTWEGEAKTTPPPNG